MARIFSFTDLETFFHTTNSEGEGEEGSPSTTTATSGTNRSDGNTSNSFGRTEDDTIRGNESNSSNNSGGTSLLSVIFKKLASFLTLKFDEQIALTGIVSQVYLTVCLPYYYIPY
jgi:hypothetical protein